MIPFPDSLSKEATVIEIRVQTLMSTVTWNDVTTTTSYGDVDTCWGSGLTFQTIIKQYGSIINNPPPLQGFSFQLSENFSNTLIYFMVAIHCYRHCCTLMYAYQFFPSTPHGCSKPSFLLNKWPQHFLISCLFHI